MLGTSNRRYFEDLVLSRGTKLGSSPCGILLAAQASLFDGQKGKPGLGQNVCLARTGWVGRGGEADKFLCDEGFQVVMPEVRAAPGAHVFHQRLEGFRRVAEIEDLPLLF